MTITMSTNIYKKHMRIYTNDRTSSGGPPSIKDVDGFLYFCSLCPSGHQSLFLGARLELSINLLPEETH